MYPFEKPILEFEVAAIRSGPDDHERRADAIFYRHLSEVAAVPGAAAIVADELETTFDLILVQVIVSAPISWKCHRVETSGEFLFGHVDAEGLAFTTGGVLIGNGWS